MPYTVTGVTPSDYVEGASGTVRVTYDFALHGGAVGNIDLPELNLPAKSFITGGGIHVITAPTSGGSATITLSVGGAALKGSTAIASFTGEIAFGTMPVYSSTGGKLRVAVGTAALTAGKFDVVIQYTIASA